MSSPVPGIRELPVLTQLIAVTGDVDLHCMVVVVPAGLLHHRIFLLPFAVNTYVGGDSLRPCKLCVSWNFHPLILASIRGSCLQHY